MNLTEMSVFMLYLLFMIGIGVYFFFKSKAGGEKSYFLGGRAMSPWVAGLSAGASDMSAWVLMGLPTSIYALGMGQLWIPIGLALGYALSWIFEAPRLRSFSITAEDSVTIPQYLTNRFLSKSNGLQVLCAIVFLIAYTVYAASSMKACGTLFHTVTGMNEVVAMYVAALIIVGYTFMGGFSAVCWTDFFQALLILAAMMFVPIGAMSVIDFSASGSIASADYWNMFASWKDIVSGLAWGLGYFGMPHIIIRFMSLKSQKGMKKAAAVGIAWTTLIVIFATVIGICGRLYLGYDEQIEKDSIVFIVMVRKLFPAIISGLLLSAVLAASMSTADSQLLSAASAVASDVYKPVIRKNKISNTEMLWVGRVLVLLVSLAAIFIAANPESGSIMSLVSNAWAVFGSSFGPVILLSLFWRRFTFAGAFAGIFAGAAVDICWMQFLGSTGIYELFPGFIAGTLFAVIVSLLTPAPSKEVDEIFDKALALDD
ncbi:MAG: sodium/proline symporter [Abditibacteriota bacterium]|nr:sodium/proline symporter [Abditibacteriota bacterium]